MWASPEDQRKIGKRLAAIRLAANVTQEAIAAALGKPQSFVSSLENGQRRLDLIEFLRITEVLKVDAVEVFADIAEEVTGKMSRRRKSP